jgi:hypothetical protein
MGTQRQNHPTVDRGIDQPPKFEVNSPFTANMRKFISIRRFTEFAASRIYRVAIFFNLYSFPRFLQEELSQSGSKDSAWGKEFFEELLLCLCAIIDLILGNI